MKKEIGIGIIGAGFMGKVHSNAYKTIEYIYNDRGFCPSLEYLGSVTEEDAKENAQRYGYKKSCAGWNQIVDDPKVSVVDVSLGDRLHMQASLDAIKAGKHVICEKPLAPTAKEAKQMMTAAEKAGIKNMCGFSYRFIPAVIYAKQLIDEGAIGEIYNFNGRYYQDAGSDPNRPAEKVWYAMGAKSTGVARGVGSHIIDMSRFLMGEVISVCGRTDTFNRTRKSGNGIIEVKCDEMMSAIVEYESGASGIITASAIASGRKNQIQFDIYGTLGSISFDIEHINYLNVFIRDNNKFGVSGFERVDVTQRDLNHPFADIWWPAGHGIGWEHGHINELAHFLQCVANDEDVAPYGATFEDGYKAAAIIEAIEQSQASGKKIKMVY